MDVFSVLKLLGGLAFFLFGMEVMSSELKKLSGGTFEMFLEKMTDTPLKGVLTGAVVTAAVQSSSVVTVAVVGFVNSGILTLSQSVGVIMGANIGTTATSWLLSLMTVESPGIAAKILKPENLFSLIAFLGIFSVFVDGNGKKKSIGSALMGFSILMCGMAAMTESVRPLAENEAFASVLLKFSNPFLGILAGAVFTGVLQSSSASVGILQALSSTGAVTAGSAVPLLLGQNIGTCVTALISGIGASENAKRAAAVHFYFNVIGSFLFLAVFYAADFFMDLPFKDNPLDPIGIASFHTVFNLFSTAVLLPFSEKLEHLAVVTVGHERKQKPKIY